MASYFLAGHETLANRGCEALVRGISEIVRSFDTDASFIAPSYDPSGDRKQWGSDPSGVVRFVNAYRLPVHARAWVKVQRKFPWIRNLYLPSPGIPSSLTREVSSCTAGILTGGDILSLDYGIPSLLKWIGQAECFSASGRPMVLWAGSVGPFAADPFIERRMVRHLRTYADVSVRESATFEYLTGLGLENVRIVADPAFVMQPQPWNVEAIFPRDPGSGLLGFNVSPLVKEFRGRAAGPTLEESVVAFLRHVVEETDYSLVLIPHVDTPDGSAWNSDFLYMQRLVELASLPPERCVLAPRYMNAPSVKYLISKCRFFIGARTHSTIAAWTTHVPTISIAYSVKARGLNRDLFGDQRYIVETPAVTKETLIDALSLLEQDETGIRDLLGTKIPVFKQRAHDAAQFLKLKFEGNT